MSLLSRLKGLFQIHRLDRELDEELRSHIEMRTTDNIAAGMSANEARYDAQRRFGNSTLMKEDTRSMDIVGWLETTAEDLRYGLRTLRKSPGFTATGHRSHDSDFQRRRCDAVASLAVPTTGAARKHRG